MPRYIEILSSESNSRGQGSFLIWPGILLFCFGFLILIMPRLLALLVSSFFMVTGVFCIWIGYKAKKINHSGTITVETKTSDWNDQ